MYSFLNSKYTENNRVEYNKPSLMISIDSEHRNCNSFEKVRSFDKNISYNGEGSLNTRPNLKMNSARLCKSRRAVGEATLPGFKVGKEKRLGLIRDALISLYVDRTKPHLQELFRRLKGRIDLGPNYHLQTMIKDLSGSGEFLLLDNGEVYLRNYCVPEDHWVDPKNPNNPYSREIWSGFLQYINDLVSIRGETNNSYRITQNPNDYCTTEARDDSKHNPRRDELSLTAQPNESKPPIQSLMLPGSSSSSSTLSSANPQPQPQSLRYQFKGGRYGVALDIHKAKIPYLENLSLGELSHLVQLAINVGILQYENNVLKPRCTCTKIAAAALSVDVDQIDGGEAPLNCDSSLPSATTLYSLEELKHKLNEILIMYPNGILLSLLKRFFHTYWGKKLSSTAFGYTHISTLLLSDELRQICRLYFDSSNHVIVQSTQFDFPKHVRLLEDEKFQKKNPLFDVTLFVPPRNMHDISFEYMKLQNKQSSLSPTSNSLLLSSSLKD